MAKSFWNSLLAAGCLGLAACAGQAPLSPADAVASLRSGRALLSCREPCLAEWQRVEPEAAKFDAAARWTDLAVLVLQAGYQDDLTLYYLGRAAEGLGLPGAAASYYRQSARFSGTSNSCQNMSRLCGGVVLPSAALLREAAITSELDRRLYPRRRPEPRTPSRPGTLPSETAEPSAAEPAVAAGAPTEVAPPPLPPVPAPPLPLVPAPPPVPAPVPAQRPHSDYIEPPPASR